MTDRLPIVDGAPACPFVAYDDDRDARALAPDHRHRCFAEPRPAPRALAHQEAYCLSSAFPVCPTFQDWARREAAAARPAASDDHAAPDEAPVSRPLPPRERDPRHAPGTDTPPPIPPRRHHARDWAAPPPWSDEDDAAAGDAGTAGAVGAAGAASGALWGAGTAAGAGATAGAARAGGPDEVAPPAFLASRTPSRDEDWEAASRGLAGSAADRLAGPADDEPPLPRVSRAPVTGRSTADQAGIEELDDRPQHDDWPAPPSRAPAAGGDRRGAARRPAASAPRRDQGRHPRDEDPESLFGPAWERPRRYEAYPTLRTRMGLPSFSNLWIAVAALVLAGAVLFFLGPMLLGLGGQSPDTGGRTAAPSASASASPSPTLPPEPTAQVYVVAKGDTMSKIAKRFDVTVEQLLAANPQIKNADRIKIGDPITIPVPVPDEVPGGAEESVEP